MFHKQRYKYYNSLLKRNLIAPQVICVIDGGICSQMHQYLLGQLYRQKGYKLRYDLSFYKKWGSDLNHQFVRNFDLLKAFPYLKMKTASRIAIELYMNKYLRLGNNSGQRVEDFSFLQWVPPVFLAGYYHLPPEVWLPAFRALYKVDLSVLDLANRELIDEISKHETSVAVHVRRGDLKVELYEYGKPVSIEYFQKATSYFMKNMKSPFFYFFSDEPEWVHEELIGCLHLTDNYKIVNINGSDKGYMDLFLIAHCKHQITSKGTLGKYGALLMDNPGKIVIMSDDGSEERWKRLFQNPVYL